jgi:hypothetical protein
VKQEWSTGTGLAGEIAALCNHRILIVSNKCVEIVSKPGRDDSPVVEICAFGSNTGDTKIHRPPHHGCRDTS